MIYELRIYECYGGRLPNLNKRFSEHTCALFEKHGIKNVGYWTNLVGPSNNDLIYLVASTTWARGNARGPHFRRIQSGRRQRRRPKRMA